MILRQHGIVEWIILCIFHVDPFLNVAILSVPGHYWWILHFVPIFIPVTLLYRPHLEGEMIPANTSPTPFCSWKHQKRRGMGIHPEGMRRDQLLVNQLISSYPCTHTKPYLQPPLHVYVHVGRCHGGQFLSWHIRISCTWYFKRFPFCLARMEETHRGMLRALIHRALIVHKWVLEGELPKTEP